MSKKDSKSSDTDNGNPVEEPAAADDDAKFAEPDVGADEPAEFIVTADKPRRSGGLATILSAIALIIAAVAAYLSWSLSQNSLDGADATNRAEAEIASLTESLSAARSSLDEVEDKLARLTETDVTYLRQIEEIERQLVDRMQELASLPGRVGSLESSIRTLRGISSGVRDAWLLAEAEYYMQLANAQLQLAGNSQMAILALRLADDRIGQLADPALTEIRRALATELRSLDAMDVPDIEGIALMLANLATVVDSLPLREQLQTIDEEDPPEEAVDPELSGVDRAIAAVKRTMSGIVSVRRTDAPIEPLLAPNERYFLRANLSLQLQAARLALMQREQTIFEQSLDDASTWLAQYFESENAAVISAIETIAEVRGVSFVSDIPDISSSLRLLRQHRSLSEAIQDTPDVELEEPVPTDGNEESPAPESEQ